MPQRRRWLMASVMLAVLGLAPAAAPASATFPGTNGRVVFVSDSPFNRNWWAIHTMNPDGSGLDHRITVLGLLPDPPVLSPDGSKIVYARWRQDFSEIHIINAEGSPEDQELVSPFPRNRDPAWSPDGSMIVFAGDRNDPNVDCWRDSTCSHDIFVMPADGEPPAQQLTFGGGNDRRPRFSPDGRFVAFDSTVGGVAAVYKVDVETLQITKLTPDHLQAAQPEWSPDGRKITFVNNHVSSCPGKIKTCFSDVFVMSADGASITQLTRDFGNNLGPTWSPEGDKLVFSHDNNAKFNQAHLYLINPDGTGLTQITNRTHRNIYPDWGPAG